MKVNERPVERYAVKARTRNGTVHTLLLADERRHASYLEREIERAFAIQDRPIAGELPKD